MHCLLLGNGLNRLTMQLSWSDLLEKLASDLGLAGQLDNHASKPLSLLFEELCVRLPDFEKTRDAEHSVKKHIAKLMGEFPPHPLLLRLAPRFQVILTTNYDISVEDALAGHLYTSRPLLPESRYSLFRRTTVGTRSVWHIHGESSRPQSIMLGYDHYAGYLQKVRNYLTSGLPTEGRVGHIRSPLRSGAQDFERYEAPHSWVDHFLRDHIHIVGLGIDFTEIDLWWLLVYKRRRDTKTGKTFFYAIDLDGELEVRDRAKFSLFASMGVDVSVVRAENYAEGYEKVVSAVEENMALHTTWLPHIVQHRTSPQILAPSKLPNGEENAKEGMQLRLKLRRKNQGTA